MTVLPNQAVIAVTFRCNGRCIMCNIWKAEAAPEASPALYDRLPQTLKTINVTGGEPFLRKDLAEIIYIMKRRCRNPRIVISTNGLAPHLIEGQLGEMGKRRKGVGIRISVDGVGAAHDAIRGVEGAFDKAMSSVEICKKLGVADLGLGFTVMNENAGQLEPVYNLTRKLGIQLAVSIAQNAEIFFCVENIKPISESGLLRSQLENMASDQLRSFRVKDWFRAYFLNGLYRYSTGKSPLDACTAAADFFFMDPQGGIYVCPILDMKLGNLVDSSFEEVWNSNETLAARKFASTCPKKCWMACTAAPYMRRHMLKASWWVVTRKIMAHMMKSKAIIE